MRWCQVEALDNNWKMRIRLQQSMLKHCSVFVMYAQFERAPQEIHRLRDELERSKADTAGLAKRNSVLSETNRSLAVEIDEKRSTLEVSMQEKVCRWLRIQQQYRSVILVTSTAGYLSFHHMAVLCMRSKAWLAAPVLLAHAEVKET
jgi:hypothetical protein